jgi:hypothetical protein
MPRLAAVLSQKTFKTAPTSVKGGSTIRSSHGKPGAKELRDELKGLAGEVLGRACDGTSWTKSARIPTPFSAPPLTVAYRASERFDAHRIPCRGNATVGLCSSIDTRPLLLAGFDLSGAGLTAPFAACEGWLRQRRGLRTPAAH